MASANFEANIPTYAFPVKSISFALLSMALVLHVHEPLGLIPGLKHISLDS
jgi:hypothetical protein